MKRMIKRLEKDGLACVSARELYDFLCFDGSHWRRWYRKYIIRNVFVSEGIDWSWRVPVVWGCRNEDFYISIPFAINLSKLEKTGMGDILSDYLNSFETGVVIPKFLPPE